MAGGVTNPTVLVGLGRFGREVVDRALESMDAADPRLDVLRCEASGVAEGLKPRLEKLLRAGLGRGEPRDQRLDILLFGAALQGGDGDLLLACEQAARLVGEGYGAVFPPDRPPDQRAAALHVVVQVPALSSPRGAQALARVQAVEEWAASGASFPLLAKVWLGAQQTAAGTLTAEGMVTTCAALATALVGSGLRDEDAVGRRLAHPAPGEGRVGFVSVASIGVPQSRLREYASARAAYDALGELVDRVEAPAPDAAIALGAVSALKRETWLTTFTEGAAAERCRKLGRTLSRGPGEWPVVGKVGTFETAQSVRARYATLFEKAAGRAPTPQDGAEADETLRALDRIEAEALATVEASVEAVLTSALNPALGLERLPAVESGLSRVRAELEDAQGKDAAARQKLEDSRETPGARELHLEELEAALRALPERSTLWAVAGAAGVAALVLVVAATLALGTPAVAPATSGISSVQLGPAPAATGGGLSFREVLPWLLGLLAFAGASSAWAALAGRGARLGVEQALQRRLDALIEQDARSTAGRQAELQLLLRRRRLRRGAMLVLDHALNRLGAIRRSLHEARDFWKAKLGALGVTPAAEARLDNLAPLLGPDGPLDALLAPPQVLSGWVAGCRELAEDKVWANRLLEGCWPQRAVLEDVPCADASRVADLCLDQVRPLGKRSLFDDAEARGAVAASLDAFARRASAALAPPCQPRNEHGDPVPGVRAGEQWVVAPAAGRDVVGDSLREAAPRIPVLWTGSPAPRVLLLRTWEGYTVDEVARGAGHPLAAPGRAG